MMFTIDMFSRSVDSLGMSLSGSAITITDADVSWAELSLNLDLVTGVVSVIAVAFFAFVVILVLSNVEPRPALSVALVSGLFSLLSFAVVAMVLAISQSSVVPEAAEVGNFSVSISTPVEQAFGADSQYYLITGLSEGEAVDAEAGGNLSEYDPESESFSGLIHVVNDVTGSEGMYDVVVTLDNELTFTEVSEADNLNDFRAEIETAVQAERDEEG